MMLRVNKNPARREIRQTALVFVIGFMLIAGLLAWKGKLPPAVGLAISSLLIGALSWISDSFGRLFYRLWMGFAFILGSFWSRVILALIFYGLITPIALFFRLIKRDVLRVKRDPEARSYWVDHPRAFPPSYYDRLF